MARKPEMKCFLFNVTVSAQLCVRAPNIVVARALAHLAETAFAGLRSETLTIGCCRDILSEDWPWEIADLNSEWGCGVSAMFTDGSRLDIDAWGDI